MRGAHKAIRGANKAIGVIQSNGADRVSGATGANRMDREEQMEQEEPRGAIYILQTNRVIGVM